MFGDGQYFYENYYFFMIDDRFMLFFIPRFSSIFLEPGHLGTATTLLLMTQFGHWRKWYNVVLIFVSLITFSLAAYAIMLALFFFSAWVQRRNIILKFVVVSALIAAGVATAINYNGGDNMVNELILSRLEVDDRTGEMAGNNRVTDDFEAEYDRFTRSSDLLLGRDMGKTGLGMGNSGYRVFIYEYGLLGLLLVVLLYGLAFRGYTDARYLLCAIFFALLTFWIRGYPLWYSNFIPFLLCAHKRNSP